MAKIKSTKSPIQMGMGNEKTERREMEVKWDKGRICKWKIFFLVKLYKMLVCQENRTKC